MNRIVSTVIIAIATLIPISAFADDWVATKLRGHVLQLVAGQWEPLARGDIIPDDRVIRTLKDGRVEFQRDKETISLAADTQIQIADRNGSKYTTVRQYFGQIEVEAEVRNVRHFEVDTPYLAAVVKGTRFVVTSGDRGASVKVKRGLVSVGAAGSDAHADIPAGQTVDVGSNGAFSLSGPGSSKTIILGANGLPIAGNVTGAPGQNPDFTPPGLDPDFTPPGRDKDKDKDED